MKKQYIAPACKGIKICTSTPLAGSPSVSSEYSDPTKEALSKKLFDTDLSEDDENLFSE